VNSPESLVGMIAAGRGIFLSPEIAIGGRTAAIDFYRLNERESQFELFTIWKKQSEGAPTNSQIHRDSARVDKGFWSRLRKGEGIPLTEYRLDVVDTTIQKSTHF